MSGKGHYVHARSERQRRPRTPSETVLLSRYVHRVDDAPPDAVVLPRRDGRQSSPGTWCKSSAPRSSVKRLAAQAAWSSGHLLLDLLVCVIVWSCEDERDRLGREVAAADEPLVVLFDAEHPGEADQRAVVGEDADDVGAPADLFVEALERVGRAQLAPVRGAGTRRRRGCRPRRPRACAATFASRPSRCATASESRSRACASESALKIGRISAASRPCWSLRAWPEAVAQEVDGAALPGAAEDLRDRGLQAGVRVGDGQLDADQAALDQASEEVGPERLGLGLADIDARGSRAARSRARRARSPAPC